MSRAEKIGCRLKFESCRSPGLVYNIGRMSPTVQTTTGTGQRPVWDADLIFELFGDPVRRGLFLGIARHQPIAPSLLRDKVRRDLDTALKRLAIMRSKGLVILKRDPTDKRRQFCSLAPSVPITTSDTGRVLAFGFLNVPLDAGVATSAWDQDAVYMMLGDPRRRKMLRALAEKASQRAWDLAPSGIHSMDNERKHLVQLRAAGLVVMKPDERDARRQLYSLAPILPVRTTEAGYTFDFGFCSVTL